MSQLVFVLSAETRSPEDLQWTVEKFAQVLKELREDGVNISDQHSVHLGEAASRVLDASAIELRKEPR